jgi:hypothetical protein
MVKRTRLNVTFIHALPVLLYGNKPIKNKHFPDRIFAETTDVEPSPVSGIDGSWILNSYTRSCEMQSVCVCVHTPTPAGF